MQGVSAGFFHLGELQMYPIQKYYITKQALAEAQTLMQAAEVLPSEATTSDFSTLQKAYDDFMYKVFGIVPSGIDETIENGSNTSNSNSYYDLSGRKVSNPKQSGIYIVNNKKILVK
jgi:hypothetical protein